MFIFGGAGSKERRDDSTDAVEARDNFVTQWDSVRYRETCDIEVEND